MLRAVGVVIDFMVASVLALVVMLLVQLALKVVGLSGPLGWVSSAAWLGFYVLYYWYFHGPAHASPGWQVTHWRSYW